MDGQQGDKSRYVFKHDESYSFKHERYVFKLDMYIRFNEQQTLTLYV